MSNMYFALIITYYYGSTYVTCTVYIYYCFHVCVESYDTEIKEHSFKCCLVQPLHKVVLITNGLWHKIIFRLLC